MVNTDNFKGQVCGSSFKAGEDVFWAIFVPGFNNVV